MVAAHAAVLTGVVQPCVAQRKERVHAEPAGWTIQDQAEHTDLLTTHPYPMHSRHTAQDPLDTIRTTLHASAETRMYADIGGKPCFVEEIGTMGPMMGDWQAASDFLRCNLFSLWANDCRGLLWWCAYDQTRLTHAPYDAVAVERELGLFDEDHRPKPMLAELTRFAALLPSLPPNLPELRIDAACILTRGQDPWAAAYSAWVLATQAKITLRFAWADAPLPDADVYFLPSVTGVQPSHAGAGRRCWTASPPAPHSTSRWAMASSSRSATCSASACTHEDSALPRRPSRCPPVNGSRPTSDRSSAWRWSRAPRSWHRPTMAHRS